jgi:hypothetical protein
MSSTNDGIYLRMPATNNSEKSRDGDFKLEAMWLGLQWLSYMTYPGSLSGEGV